MGKLEKFGKLIGKAPNILRKICWGKLWDKYSSSTYIWGELTHLLSGKNHQVWEN
jgi:hypothetical protein